MNIACYQLINDIERSTGDIDEKQFEDYICQLAEMYLRNSGNYVEDQNPIINIFKENLHIQPSFKKSIKMTERSACEYNSDLTLEQNI